MGSSSRFLFKLYASISSSVGSLQSMVPAMELYGLFLSSIDSKRSAALFCASSLLRAAFSFSSFSFSFISDSESEDSSLLELELEEELELFFFFFFLLFFFFFFSFSLTLSVLICRSDLTSSFCTAGGKVSVESLTVLPASPVQ